jgi:hypothetical protein
VLDGLGKHSGVSMRRDQTLARAARSLHEDFTTPNTSVDVCTQDQTAQHTGEISNPTPGI